MNLRLPSLRTILVCSAVVLCAVGTRAFAKTMEEVSNGVKNMLQGYEIKINEGFKEKDPAPLMAYAEPNAWSADATGFSPVSAAPTMMKDIDIQSYTIEDYRAWQVNDDTIVSTYVWKGTGSYKGQAFPNAPCYCSTVWTKDGKEWKAAFHQETYGMEAVSHASASH